ncbi:hypothetical protein MBEHAL_0436 [Halarchaeum acidiphilum MH1-52-1]|uniref:Uncharacterized protein n=2 Tax=Halarchaeum acidiphilum TaxID=489138 RepID=U2YDC7_9EURY|nr:hypothetical protein MBEHAL_0436 [Halarchaeum acidiphilum MH1-52-1]
MPHAGPPHATPLAAGARVNPVDVVLTAHMDVRVHGSVPAGPFLGARDLFEHQYEVEKPVHVRVREDPDERTWAGHYDDRHVLNISRRAATSVMARELALHEYAHMARYEDEHVSHTMGLSEVLFLALPGRRVERHVLRQCEQLANHAKDIYADDITLDVAPTDRLLTFLESQLAAAVAERPPTETEPAGGYRLTAVADPELTAVNAAFALALLERHDAVPDDHRIYEFADLADADAPGIDVAWFKERFRTLARDPDESAHRHALVDLVRTYVDGHETTTGPAAD